MVIIGTPSQHLCVASEGSADQLRVALVAPGIRAEIDVYVFREFGALVALFDSMEDSWRGWEGERSWASLEGELTLRARHVGSAIEIVVGMRSMFPPVDGEWSVRAELRVEVGAQLSAIVRDLRTLVATP